jgi:hypothetical protein
MMERLISRVPGSLAFILVTALARDATAAPAAAVTIRIHDYAHVQRAALVDAQRIVSRMYEGIGVRTEWLEPVRPSQDRRLPAWTATDLTLIVLSAEMSGRRVLPHSVVGYAAVSRGAPGRIAFVIYDRLVTAARDTGADRTDMMGMVMAHELGHLLLPDGSHSDDGVMRAHWGAEDLRRMRPLDLRFSIAQAEEIHRTLSGAAAAAPSCAAGGTADPDTRVDRPATIVDCPRQLAPLSAPGRAATLLLGSSAQAPPPATGR